MLDWLWILRLLPLSVDRPHQVPALWKRFCETGSGYGSAHFEGMDQRIIPALMWKQGVRGFDPLPMILRIIISEFTSYCLTTCRWPTNWYMFNILLGKICQPQWRTPVTNMIPTEWVRMIVLNGRHDGQFVDQCRGTMGGWLTLGYAMIFVERDRTSHNGSAKRTSSRIMVPHWLHQKKCILSLEDVEIIHNSLVGRSRRAIRTGPEDGRERGSSMAKSSGRRVIFHISYAKLALFKYVQMSFLIFLEYR